MYESEIEGLLRLETSGETSVSNLATQVLELVAVLRDAELRVELAEAHRDAARAKIERIRAFLNRQKTEPDAALAILTELAEIVD